MEVDVVAVTAVNDIPVFQHSSTNALRESHTTIGFILRVLEINQNPEPTLLQGQSPEVRQLLQLWDQLVSYDSLFHRQFVNVETNDNHLQLVLPDVYHNKILQQLHNGMVGGNLGQDKTLSCLK